MNERPTVLSRVFFVLLLVSSSVAVTIAMIAIWRDDLGDVMSRVLWTSLALTLFSLMSLVATRAMSYRES